MQQDPAGHYATLGVEPDAHAEAIVAAFRAGALRLHPDVPGTGDAAAFMRLRAAYDVLGEPAARATYDRAASQPAATLEAVDPVADPEVRATLRAAWARPEGLPLALCLGCALVGLGALAFGFAGLGKPDPRPAAPAPARAPAGVPAPPAETAASAPAIPAALVGISSAYVLPAGEPAVLWRPAASDDRYVPAGALGAFTVVAVHRLVPSHGMVEVSGPGEAAGFLYADRLMPGDAVQAEHARCIYDAGTPPTNNEILEHRGTGSGQVTFDSRRNQPAVVKLRDEQGAVAASVFMAPGASVVVDHLPAGSYRPEFAFGELWSHACHRFVAGMRAQRFAEFERLDPFGTNGMRYIIPPPDGVDEPEDAFNRE